MKIWTIEFSRSQDCFHIDTLERVIETNKNMFHRGTSNDYQILGIYETYESAKKSIEFFKGVRYEPIY